MAAVILSSFSEEPEELHSIISVLPNGGRGAFRRRQRSCRLHSIISVLPNGGQKGRKFGGCLLLHSIISVLPNGGYKGILRLSPNDAALDNISATEWREETADWLNRKTSCTRWYQCYRMAVQRISNPLF